MCILIFFSFVRDNDSRIFAARSNALNFQSSALISASSQVSGSINSSSLIKSASPCTQILVMLKTFSAWARNAPIIFAFLLAVPLTKISMLGGSDSRSFSTDLLAPFFENSELLIKSALPLDLSMFFSSFFLLILVPLLALLLVGILARSLSSFWLNLRHCSFFILT